MYHTILVPLDGSHRAERVLPHVEALAQAFKARVVFLRVVERGAMLEERPQGFAPADQGKIQRREAAASYLTAWVGEFREKGIQARMRVEYGAVPQAILDVAEQEEASLIAMTGHARGAVARVLRGSVAEEVIQGTPRPVFLVRGV